MRAALLAAAGLAAVANAQDGFRTCRRIEFNEGDLDANGVFAPDAFLEEFGVRIVVRDSPGSTSQGRPAGDDYTAIPQRDGAIFDKFRKHYLWKYPVVRYYDVMTKYCELSCNKLIVFA